MYVFWFWTIIHYTFLILSVWGSTLEADFQIGPGTERVNALKACVTCMYKGQN